MAKEFLTNDFFPAFLEALADFGELHGPVVTDDDVTAFGPINKAADLRLGYSRTLLPPKKYLIPPREATLVFTPTEGYRQPPPAWKKIILLGLHPCDLQGIAYLDMVFMEQRPDPLYCERRKALTLIGLSCEPDEFCFCGNNQGEGFDIFMQQTLGGFHLTAGTPRGKAILRRISPFLTEGGTTSPPVLIKCGMAETIREASARGETFPDSPLWDDFADRCLSCGACSLCCPTCYCFDVREYGSLDGETAERLREWDNCLFTEHGGIAGGFNFRKSRRERFRYRYQHKYLGFGPTRGIVACVGCGRCREVCPVRIDLLELFKEGGHDQ